MNPSTTVDCPDCAHPLILSEFTSWGAQTNFKSIVCGQCSSPVTYPTSPDGSIQVTRAPIGRGVHGTSREAREGEVLLSRPTLEQPNT